MQPSLIETTGWLRHGSEFGVKHCQNGLETTKNTKNTKKALHVGGIKPQNTQKKDCQDGLETTKYTKNTKKGLHVILQKSHNHARYIARAHIRALLACASHFDEGVA